jgi:catechol 2,3-dioxygenase-like lactoylglutathione lyase family enzyme
VAPRRPVPHGRDIYNHTGHVVTDLARSKRFYTEVLGFRPWYEIMPPDEPTANSVASSPRSEQPPRI